MKVPLTKCFFSAVVLAVLLVLALPGTSGGFNSRFVQLSDDPNSPAPEASPGYIQPVLLVDVNEPAPEASPGYIQPGLLVDVNEPAPESSLRLDKPVLLDTEPNTPAPECYPY